MSEKAVTRITQVRTVGVPVSDQGRALDFYVGKLGFETRLDVAFGGGRWIEVGPPAGGTTIALIASGGALPTGVDTGIRLATEDDDADHAALKAGGVDVDPEVMRMGNGVPPMFSLRDPDANRLIIVGNP
jgi:catechol 2,3-dioxygenase-like lactoylglutathione lyase family enzyme